MLAVDSRIRVPLRELRFRFSRSSGPGGQNVNKVNTKATLHWNVEANRSLPADVRERFAARYRRRISANGELVISSQRFRDRGRNVADCLEKLRALLADVASAPRPRRETRPTKGARERRLAEKRARSETKQRRRRPSED
jgi:ribosome-associated protein